MTASVRNLPLALNAEYHLGIVAGDDSLPIAQRNCQRFTSAFENSWSGGNFAYHKGQLHDTEVDRPIVVPPREIYTAGTIKTASRHGASLLGYGTRSYGYPTLGYLPIAGVTGGCVSRITRIDGENGGSVLRSRGSAFTGDGFEIRGRRYYFDPTGEGPTGVGSLPSPADTKTPTGIELEAHAQPTVGLHTLRTLSIHSCTRGIVALGGYYDADDVFVVSEQNCDTSIFDGILFQGCNSCFRSENEQSVVFRFRDPIVAYWGGAGHEAVTVFDITRGGNIWCDGLSLIHPDATLFDFTTYTGTRRNTCTDMRWDHGEASASNRLTLFKFSGPTESNMAAYKYSIRITGELANEDPANPSFDVSRLIDVPRGKNFPVDDILLDITGLPTAGFTIVGSGPWYRPNSSWTT